MKVEYVSPFAEASVHVFETLIGCRPERGGLSARPQMFTSQQINIVCGITGQIEGLVIYGMSMITADKIASKMIGAPVVTFDQLAASAIAELGNIISGNSASLLHAQGFYCDITPPTIIRGSNVSVTTLDIPAIVIPMTLAEIGLFEVNVSLQERTRLAA
ncbi:MAG: chemotaxis protein CheX [Fimbriimonadaceae bacterium]|nr:chemotaxis protein CheX [Fimbriimonadaceae bacterium]